MSSAAQGYSAKSPSGTPIVSSQSGKPGAHLAAASPAGVSIVSSQSDCSAAQMAAKAPADSCSSSTSEADVPSFAAACRAGSSFVLRIA
jgi:hypothetical protein